MFKSKTLDTANNAIEKSTFDLSVFMFFVVLLSVCLTLYLYKNNLHNLNNRNNEYFMSLVSENKDSVLNLLESYEKLLVSGRAFFHREENIDRQKWKEYVQHLELKRNYPGINGIGFIKAVKAEYIHKFIEEEQKNLPSFMPHPAKGEPFFIITYIEPVEGNQQAIGLNVSFEENRYEAAIRSMKTGKIALTNKILLVQDSLQRPGFLIFLPFYKGGNIPVDEGKREQDILGWIYAPFIGENFINSMQRDQRRFFRIRAYDGEGMTQSSLLFDSGGDRDEFHQPVHRYQTRINIMQQTWTLVWESTREFDTTVKSVQPNIVLYSGLAFTFVLMLLFFSLANRDRKVTTLVHEKSREIIEKQKQLSESEQIFRSAMENSPAGIGLLYPDGRWMKMNASLCNILGYTAEELEAGNFQIITHPDDLPVDMQNVNRLLLGECDSYQMEKRYIHKSGRIIWALLTVALIKKEDGSPHFFISQVIDITENKNLEQIKDDFITVISHELRTPISSISLALSLLPDRLENADPETMTLFNMAYRNCQRLISLVADILDLRKLSLGLIEYDVRVCNANQILISAMEESKALSIQYGTIFKLEALQSCPLQIRVDETRVLQILLNFLSNASKFSPEGSEVLIFSELKEQKVRLAVRDFGVGIPDTHKDKIFQKFGQVTPSFNKKIQGTGLGLFISSEMAQQMGGAVGFESEIGKGSVFWCEFPLSS